MSTCTVVGGKDSEHSLSSGARLSLRTSAVRVFSDADPLVPFVSVVVASADSDVVPGALE